MVAVDAFAYIFKFHNPAFMSDFVIELASLVNVASFLGTLATKLL